MKIVKSSKVAEKLQDKLLAIKAAREADERDVEEGLPDLFEYIALFFHRIRLNLYIKFAARVEVSFPINNIKLGRILADELRSAGYHEVDHKRSWRKIDFEIRTDLEKVLKKK